MRRAFYLKNITICFISIYLYRFRQICYNIKFKRMVIIIIYRFSMIISIGLCLYSLNFGKIDQMLIKTLLFYVFFQISYFI